MNKKTQNNNSKWKICIVGFLLIFAALYICIYVVPRVSNIFVETYVAEYGTLESGVEAECLFVREERVYTASGAGKIERVLSQGKLVRKGSKVVNLAGTGCYTEERGVISYYYDGMEKLLTPDNIEKITVSNLQKAEADDFTVGECKKKNAETGDKLFKIVDNKEWFLLAWLSDEDARGFEEGNNVTVDFYDGTRLKMKIKSVTAENGKQKVVLSCNRYYEFFDQYRLKKCKLIRSSRTGILIETSSIVTENNKEGVYVKDKFGSYNFTPVSILATDKGVSVVEKNYFYDEDGNTVITVKNYDEILRNKSDELKGSEEDVN